MASLNIIPVVVPILVCWVLDNPSTTSANTNITLVSFPVNVTSLKLSAQDAFNRPLDGLRGALENYVQSVKDGTNDCVEEGGECTPETSSCCIIPDYDLECLPSGDSDVYICSRLRSSDELAQQRIDGLQYGDSKGMVNSHPWADSWEFQSKSEMAKEEEQAEADLKWSRSLNLSRPNSDDNVWSKTYKKIKNGGKNIWQDLKKINKLRDIKKNLIDKYLKRDESNDVSEKSEEVATVTESPEIVEVETKPTEKTRKIARIEEPFSDYSWFYNDIKSSSVKNESGSDESFIKFSNEIPKQDNNIDFRIEDIIRDAAKLLKKKLKENTEAKKTLQQPGMQSPSSLQDPLFHNDIMGSEEKLRKEINELDVLKEQVRKEKKSQKAGDPNHDELIRKHVAAILEEERKLDKLKKLKEFNRLDKSS